MESGADVAVQESLLPQWFRGGGCAPEEELKWDRNGLELGLVDGFRLENRGRLATVPVAGQRLLAFLALNNRPLRRAYVAGSLWPDETEDRSAGRLRGALFRLRQAGLDIVITMDGRLHLDPRLVVDIQVIEASIDRLGDAARVPGDCGPWLAALSGELLPDWYEDWLHVERERYRQLRLHGLEALCIGLTARGRFSVAVQAGLACVAADPLRESAHRALIHAYLEEGNPSQAVRQYQRFREAAETELGLGPTERMQKLVRPFVSDA
jgi:DNA-binding SARP family transcriptional activator